MNLKHLLSFLPVAFLMLSGCNDDEAGPDFTNQPEARAENDDSGKGIYKGVIIGSSGYVKLNIDNEGDGNISMTLFIDGVSYELTTEQVYNPEFGFQGYFRGTVGGSMASIGFYTLADGNSYGFFEVNIPGHPNACLQLVKEYSASLVRVFNGTFAGDQTGLINLILTSEEWEAIARETDAADCAELEGSISNNTLTCNCDVDGDGTGDVEFNGTINGNNLSGTYASSDGGISGTWSATRVF